MKLALPGSWPEEISSDPGFVGTKDTGRRDGGLLSSAAQAKLRDSGGLIAAHAPYIGIMAQWQGSIARQPPKTKAELRQMLAEAVRNTQASADASPKRPAKAKNDQS